MDLSDYENKTKRPKMPSRPRLSPKHTADDAKAYAVDFETYCTQMSEYEESVKVYQKEQGRLNELFRTDAIDEAGLSGHPKAGKAYGLAYERCHAFGRGDVFNFLCDLADLLLND